MTSNVQAIASNTPATAAVSSSVGSVQSKVSTTSATPPPPSAGTPAPSAAGNASYSTSNPNVITLYTVYIFDKAGRCLYYWENNRPYNSLADNPDEEKRLVFGLVFSLKHFSLKLSPNYGEADDDCSLKTVRTSAYTLHHYESITGYKFVANTSVCQPKQDKDIHGLLIKLYKDVFIGYVLQNPLYRIGDPIRFPKFQEEVEILLLGKRKSLSSNPYSASTAGSDNTL